MGEQTFGLVLPREDAETHHIAGPEGAARKDMWPKGPTLVGAGSNVGPHFVSGIPRGIHCA